VLKRFSLPARKVNLRLAPLLCCVAVCAVTTLHARGEHPVAPVAHRPAVLEQTWFGRTVAASTIDPRVLNMALRAADCAVASNTISRLSTLTVIDYSKPSTEERLWVFDVPRRALLYQELVAHGQGSGEDRATAFSNEPESHQSSLGLFETGDSYIGSNGYSLRLRGLETGFNDKALERAIVMHGAPYVSEAFIRSTGRLGRSWGCPALANGIAREVIDTIKGSGLVFAYYPDQRWLDRSKFLGSCGASQF
jgi:hypothetical protein